MTHGSRSAGGDGRKSKSRYAEKTRYRGGAVYQREKRTVVEVLNGFGSEEVGACCGLAVTLAVSSCMMK